MYMMCINTGVAVQPDGRGAVQEGGGSTDVHDMYNTGVAVQPDGRGAVQEGGGGHHAGLVPWRLAPLQPEGPRLPPAVGLAAIRLSVGYMWSPLHPVSWLHDGGHPCQLVT